MKKLLFITITLLSGVAAFGQEDTTIRLREVEVVSEAMKWKRDSARLDSVYAKTVRDVERPVDVKIIGPGIMAEGLFTKLARRVSGRDRREKKFLAMYRTMQAEKLIAIRYNPRVVSSVTGLKGEESVHFVNQHPMPEDFARSATELELKMWIRDRYKAWKPKQK